MVFRDQTLSYLDLIHFSRQFGECYRATIGDAALNGDIPREEPSSSTSRRMANHSVSSALANEFGIPICRTIQNHPSRVVSTRSKSPKALAARQVTSKWMTRLKHSPPNY